MQISARRMGVTGVLPFALASVLATSPAQAAPANSDQQLRGALAHVAAGTWSPGDLALIRQHPDIAKHVPDPQHVSFTVTSGRVSPVHVRTVSPMATATAQTCGRWVDVWERQWALGGGSMYKWHHHVQFCYNGRTVTRWQARYDYVTNTDSVINVRGLIANAQGGIGTAEAFSFKQRHIEYCIIKWGCYNEEYPWSKIRVNRNGGYSYTGHP